MPWFLEPPIASRVETPDYGAAATFSITNTSQEIVAAGSQSRYISISVAADASPIYVNYGAPVDVAAGDYVYGVPAKFQHHKLDIPAQAIYMATAAAGQTATVVIAVAE
jgi:hypothetical protein